MKKKWFALLTAAAMMLGMTACTTDAPKDEAEAEKPAAEQQGDLEDFSIVLDWYPNAIHSFLYTAMEKGYFAEEGLNLVIQFPANTNDGISLPAAKKADVGMYYQQDAILTAAEENVPVVSIGAVCQRDLNVVIALEESGIKGAKDLAGKKIGHAGTALSEAQIDSMLKNVGLSVGDTECIDVGFDLMSSITTKQVDASIGNMVNHEVPQMEKEGFKVNYFYPTDYGTPTTYELVFLANADEVQKNPEKYKAFLRACQKGFADMKANPDESLQILLDNQNEANFPLSKEVEQKSMEMLLPVMETEDAPFLHQEVEQWQKNADWMKGEGVITKDVDVSKLMVNLLEEK